MASMSTDGGVEKNCKKVRAQRPNNSKELLYIKPDRGIQDKLLITPKHSSKDGASLKTEKITRSNVLDRLQNFLPQMAQANEKLKTEMKKAPAGQFNIENIDDSSERIIEMDVALVELSDSECDDTEDSSSEDESSELDSEEEGNLRIPGNQKKKAKIEVMDNVNG
uniref:NOP protein chaperone 1 n=1 Tax=Erpetoichthys calabaricus TaxID=27687 RepID=A0A8C4RE95_ERPCA